jgi:hypothetical protein
MRQNFGSIAANRMNLKKNLVLGILISVATVSVIGLLVPFLGGAFAGFSIPMGYFILSCIVIGFEKR